MPLRALLVILALLTAAPAAHAATGTYGLGARPDYVDPALSYSLEGWTILWATHLPLLTYEHAEGEAGSRLVPGVAEALPEVSPDGLTYTLRVREGLRYSDGRAVRAGDFEHTIKRVLHLRSGGSAFFLGIRGADTYVRRRRARADIPGIVADEAARTVRVTLERPDGTFANVLAMPFAGLVPSDTPFRNTSMRPVAGVGPFRIVRSTRRGLALERDPGFAVPGLPQAALDRLDVVYGARHGTVDVHLDPPPRGMRATDRYREQETVSTYYFFLNQRRSPFDDREVRRAVHFALDKPALARLFDAAPTCTILPPRMPGHRVGDCPFGDPNGSPQLQRARDMVSAAGAAGRPVNVYGNDESPSRALTRAFAATLRSIGLRPRLRIVSGERYFATIGNQRTRAHAGFANWFADFLHPANFLFLFDADTITRRANQNFGNVDDPRVNELIDEVWTLGAPAAAGPAAEADRILVEEGHAVPFAHRRLGQLWSERVPPDCRAQHPFLEVDLARLCVTG